MPALDPYGKTAIITGGGSGIGLSFAKELYNNGCSIFIADLGLHTSAREWLQSIEHQPFPKVIFHQVDTDWENLESVFDAAEESFGTVPEIVVPGTGVYEPSSNNFCADQDSASRQNVFDVNIMHPIEISKIAIRRLRRALKTGVIVHIASSTAQIPSAVNPSYSMSKGAISQFVRCMARLDELAGIRVVAVAPNVVYNPMFRDSAIYRQHIDMENAYTLPPEEIVKAMMSLVTSSTYPSGTVLEIGDFVMARGGPV